METQPSARELYTDRVGAYHRFVAAFRYPQGLGAALRDFEPLRSDMRVMDAGCGGGIVTLALRAALAARGLRPGVTHGFDLTPTMLDRFRATIEQRDVPGVELRQADVLHLEALPDSWVDYDLIVSSGMLEYLPRHELSAALRGLRLRLAEGGALLFFMSRRNWLMKLMIERWWSGQLYSREELHACAAEAGLASVQFSPLPDGPRPARSLGAHRRGALIRSWTTLPGPTAEPVMIQVYGSPQSRAFRTLWMLDELGVEYESIEMDTHAGENRQPEFLARNPNGRVPTLVDGETVVWESMAINLYLVRKYDGGLAPRGAVEEAKALQWSFWVMTEVEQPLLDYGRHTLFLPAAERDAAIVGATAAQLAAALGVLEGELAACDYLLGSRFGVADLNVASVLFWATLVDLDVAAFRASSAGSASASHA